MANIGYPLLVFFVFFLLITTGYNSTMADENGSAVYNASETSHPPPLSTNVPRREPSHPLFAGRLEMTLETSADSNIERDIHAVLRKHFLEQSSITWKPVKVELIVNTQLTDDFLGNYPFPCTSIVRREYLDDL